MLQVYDGFSFLFITDTVPTFTFFFSVCIFWLRTLQAKHIRLVNGLGA